MGNLVIEFMLSSFYTLRLRQNGCDFTDDIFKWISINENCILIQISLKYVPKGPINNNSVLVQIMAWRRPGTKPLSEPMMVRLPMHIWISRPPWVKWKLSSLHIKPYKRKYVKIFGNFEVDSFLLSTAIRSMKLLTHCVYWLQMVTQIWVNISSGNGLLPSAKPLYEPIFISHQFMFCGIHWHQRAISQGVPKLLFCIMSLKIRLFKISATSPRGHWVKPWSGGQIWNLIQQGIMRTYQREDYMGSPGLEDLRWGWKNP